MPKVHRTNIIRNDQGHISYSDIETIDLPDHLYNKFDWDRPIIRMDMCYVDDTYPNAIVIMSNKEDVIAGCVYGMYAFIDACHNWDKIFSQETKDRLAIGLAKEVEDGTAISVSENSLVHIGEKK